MALSKVVNVTCFPLPATYWRITVIGIDYSERTAHCELAGYLDRAHRDTPRAAPLFVYSFDWCGDDFPLHDDDTSDIRAQLYAAVKAYKEKRHEPDEEGKLVEVEVPGIFTDAEDC